MISQKRSSCVLVQTLGAISWNQTRLDAILPRFLEILPRFSRILRDFQYIKTLRGALSPPPQTPLVSTEFLTYQYTCVIASGVAFRCLLWIITLVFIFNDIHKPILGYRVNYSNLIFKTMKNTMQDRHLCCPLTVSLAPQWGPHFFISRIATGNHSVQPQGEHWPPFRYASSRVFWSCPTSICAEQASWSQATRVKAVTIKILSEKSVDDLSTVPFLKKTQLMFLQ